MHSFACLSLLMDSEHIEGDEKFKVSKRSITKEKEEKDEKHHTESLGRGSNGMYASMFFCRRGGRAREMWGLVMCLVVLAAVKMLRLAFDSDSSGPAYSAACEISLTLLPSLSLAIVCSW